MIAVKFSDFGNLEVDVGAADDDILDGAVRDAVEDGGFLFGGEVGREADFGAELAEGERGEEAGFDCLAQLGSVNELCRDDFSRTRCPEVNRERCG